MKTTITPTAAAVRPLRTELPDDPDPLCECQNCDWTGPESALQDIADFHQRVDPGEECPAGECPECGCLAHVKTLEPSERLPIDFDDYDVLKEKFDTQAAEISKLRAERDALRKALQQIEWAIEPDASGHPPRCPVCGNRRNCDHDHGCAIGDALALCDKGDSK